MNDANFRSVCSFLCVSREAPLGLRKLDYANANANANAPQTARGARVSAGHVREVYPPRVGVGVRLPLHFELLDHSSQRDTVFRYGAA